MDIKLKQGISNSSDIILARGLSTIWIWLLPGLLYSDITIRQAMKTFSPGEPPPPTGRRRIIVGG